MEDKENGISSDQRRTACNQPFDFKKSEEVNRERQIQEQKQMIEVEKRDREEAVHHAKANPAPEIHIAGDEYKLNEAEDQIPVFTPEAIGLTSPQNENQEADGNKKKY